MVRNYIARLKYFAGENIILNHQKQNKAGNDFKEKEKNIRGENMKNEVTLE